MNVHEFGDFRKKKEKAASIPLWVESYFAC